MNNKITTFLDDVCIHVRCKAVHNDIRDELANHITELKEEYVSTGVDEEKALDMAISAMGSCDEIGNRLNKQHKPKTEWSLIVLTTIIAVIGAIIMYSSSKFESLQTVQFERYLFCVAVGIGVLVMLYFFDYTKLKKLALPIYLLTFVLLFFTLFSGRTINGRGFLRIGHISISSEYIPLLFLIAIAGFIEKGRGKGSSAFAGILALMLISMIPIIAINSLSIAVILVICYAVLITSSVSRNHFGGYRKLQLASIGSIGILLTALGVIFVLGRSTRLLSFITRGQSDPLGVGWIHIMADKWLTASALLGKGSATVNGYSIDMGMPGVTTNYVLINVIATLGWIVGIALVLAIAVFIWRMFVAAGKIKNSYGFYLSLGACTILSAQFVISVLINFNLFPPMSTSIPFVSYGGVGYITNMALVGLILSVWRRNNLIGASNNTTGPSKDRFIRIEDGKLIISFK